MKLKVISLAVVLVCRIAASAAEQSVNPDFMKPSGSRSFAIEYIGKVTGIPAGTKQLRIWAPVPKESTVQQIRGLTFSDQPRTTTESKYGNRIAYWEIMNPGADHEFTMRFTCERREIVMDLPRLHRDGIERSSSFEVFSGPDKLVLVDEEIRAMARKVTAGREGTLDKARAIYDYVLDKMQGDHLLAERGTFP